MQKRRDKNRSSYGIRLLFRRQFRPADVFIKSIIIMAVDKGKTSKRVIFEISRENILIHKLDKIRMKNPAILPFTTISAISGYNDY